MFLWRFNCVIFNCVHNQKEEVQLFTESKRVFETITVHDSCQRRCGGGVPGQVQHDFSTQSDDPQQSSAKSTQLYTVVSEMDAATGEVLSVQKRIFSQLQAQPPALVSAAVVSEMDEPVKFSTEDLLVKFSTEDLLVKFSGEVLNRIR